MSNNKRNKHAWHNKGIAEKERLKCEWSQMLKIRRLRSTLVVTMLRKTHNNKQIKKTEGYEVSEKGNSLLNDFAGDGRKWMINYVLQGE